MNWYLSPALYWLVFFVSLLGFVGVWLTRRAIQEYGRVAGWLLCLLVIIMLLNLVTAIGHYQLSAHLELDEAILSKQAPRQ